MEAAVRTGLQQRDCSTTLHTTHQWRDSQAAHNPPARPSSPQVLDRPRRNTKGRRWRRRPHAKRTPTCAAASVRRPEHRRTARPSHRKGSVTHSETGTPTAPAPRARGTQQPVEGGEAHPQTPRRPSHWPVAANSATTTTTKNARERHGAPGGSHPPPSLSAAAAWLQGRSRSGRDAAPPPPPATAARCPCRRRDEKGVSPYRPAATGVSAAAAGHSRPPLGPPQAASTRRSGHGASRRCTATATATATAPDRKESKIFSRSP